MWVLHVTLAVLLMFVAGIAGVGVCGFLLYVLDWWPYRPMSRRRALKVAHRAINEQYEATLYDMQVASEGGRSTRSGVWW